MDTGAVPTIDNILARRLRSIDLGPVPDGMDQGSYFAGHRQAADRCADIANIMVMEVDEKDLFEGFAKLLFDVETSAASSLFDLTEARAIRRKYQQLSSKGYSTKALTSDEAVAQLEQAIAEIRAAKGAAR